MAEEFVRLVKIGIDKGFIQDSIANADRLAKSIDELKKIRKEEGTLTAEQEGRLKALTQERNKNIQVVKQANLLTSEQIKGQERLKAQLSILTAQYNKLTTEEQKNTKEGQALQKQVLAITEELKANEKAVGNNRRNVGNYTESIKEAFNQMELERKELQNLNDELKMASQTVEKGSVNWIFYNKQIKENEAEIKKLSQGMGEVDSEIQATSAITNALSLNFKSLAEQSEEAGGANKLLSVTFGEMVSGLKSATAASLKFLATPIGAAIGALALAVGAITGAFKLFSESLNRTEEGSAALAKVTQTFSAIMNGVLKVLEPLATTVMQGVADGFDKIGQAAKTASGFIEDGLRFFGLEEQANSVNNFTGAIEDSVKGTRQLADAQVELNRINREFQKIQLDYQNRAEKLRQIRDDESRSIEERKQANVELGQVLDEQSQKELELANRSLEIARMRAEVQGESTENLDAIAAAETKVFEIEERINGQRSEQMTNINSLIREERQLIKEAAANREKDAKEALKAEKEKEEALRKSYQEERALIDEQAEYQKAQAEITIANAEERAERIAFIEKEALLAKLRSIEDETVAYTASADAIGAVDEKKYAKQLTERAKYEAQLAAIDREAKADEFNREMELLATREELANQQAEIEIANTEEREAAKQRIALKYLNERLALMEKSAMLDNIITEQERANLQKVQNEIELLQQTINNPDNKTIADMIGLSDEDLEKMFVAMEVVNGLLQAAQQATQQASDNKINNIERELQAEVNAINQSTKSEEDKEEAITKAEKKAAKEQYKIEVQQFKTAKALQIALAVANTATAVMAQLSNPTPYAGFVLAALAAATGAIQIGTIASQQPPPPPAFATGGKVIGAGTGTSDSIPARLSNGEAVINAKSTAMFEPILSAMNKAGGGVDWYRGEGFSKGGIVQKFAAGGVAMSSGAIMRDNIATREIQQTILNAPPVLVIEEFQSVQGRQVRTEQNLQV